MKIRNVNPGRVYETPEAETPYAYFIMLNNKPALHTGGFQSANSARQAMREKVAHERKRHGLSKSA